MPRQTLSNVMVVTVACVMLLSVALPWPAPRMGQGSGTVAAIEPAARTVVVEVPQGKEKCTVGGPLSAKTIVKKGGTIPRRMCRVAGHIVANSCDT